MTIIQNISYPSLANPSDTNAVTKDIVIIEDSVTTCLLLQEFLKKLGYDNVYSCCSGKQGVKVFEDLVKAGNLPLVLLDDSLPDTDANKIMNNIFEIRLDAKIVLETAEEKQDETVKDALRHGAYLYLQKPIRFENLKNAMKTIEEEDKIIEGHDKTDYESTINFLLGSSTRMSVTRLTEYTNIKKENVTEYLRQLESNGKIESICQVKEISCNSCDSVKITQDFLCASCKSRNFKQGKLIEHYGCGNVSSEGSYINNTCPKCRKEIKIIGVDYKIIDNYYSCDDCGEHFPEPVVEYVCLRCNNKFKMEQAKWLISQAFKVIK